MPDPFSIPTNEKLPRDFSRVMYPSIKAKRWAEYAKEINGKIIKKYASR